MNKRAACVFIILLTFIVTQVISGKTTISDTINVFYNSAIHQHKFAADDIKLALEAKAFSVEIKDISNLTQNYVGKKVVIALASNKKIKDLFKTQGGTVVKTLGEQAYSLQTTTTTQISYWIFGGDDNGAMYGGLQLAEYISFDGLGKNYDEHDSPHLKNRGIKFNIPLDSEAPTYFYDSRGTANKLAIEHVWDSTFWHTWFDEMARHRYNVLTLWSPHPFTAILNMEDEYPGIAIQGVTGFDENGKKVKINNWSIDEKIVFWQKVMKYGNERGFQIFFNTWNIFLSTAEGKHGITDDPMNQKTITYLNKCTKKLLETYPDLTGIGLTVGENMSTDDVKLKEKWAWDCYGSSMYEYAKANPDRDLVLIHRLLMSDIGKTVEAFKPLIDIPNVRFDMSYKYSLAHAHAAVKPVYWDRLNLEPQLDKNNIWAWLTVRNDDFFFLHWADPQFVRDYINNFPEVGKYVNAIYIGPDGWVFSREFNSKDPYYKDKNALSIQKTWYMQKLWGRIAYNPSVSDDLFKNHLAYKYPEAPSEDLFTAWSNVSRSVKLASEQVTGSWHLDFNWWPEGWTKSGPGYYTIEDTRTAEPQDGSYLCSFKNTAEGNCGDKISVFDNADEIEQLSNKALTIVGDINPGSNIELKLNMKDIEAMAYLGLFNAYKFRAVVYTEQGKKREARRNMATAYCNWKQYTNLMDELYIGVDMQRNHHFKTWHDHDADVLKDFSNLGGPDVLNCSNMYPWVKVVEPYNNQTFEYGSSISVKINTEAGENAIEKVELFNDEELIGTDNKAPYSFELEGSELGEHSLLVILYDDQGNAVNDRASIVIYNAEMKNTVPWKEDFSLPANTTTDVGLTSWSCSRPEGIFAIRDYALIVNESGDEGIFKTGVIDISGGPVKISMDVGTVGGLDPTDYVSLYKVVDGGTMELIKSLNKSQDPGTQILGEASGSTLQLLIHAKVSASDEVYYMDNLSVIYKK